MSATHPHSVMAVIIILPVYFMLIGFHSHNELDFLPKISTFSHKHRLFYDGLLNKY